MVQPAETALEPSPATSDSIMPDPDVRLSLSEFEGGRAHTLIGPERLDFPASHIVEVPGGLAVIGRPSDAAVAETFRLYLKKLGKPVVWTDRDSPGAKAVLPPKGLQELPWLNDTGLGVRPAFWFAESRILVTGTLTRKGGALDPNTAPPAAWISQLESFKQLHPEIVLSAHGKPGDARVLDEALQQLRDLPPPSSPAP